MILKHKLFKDAYRIHVYKDGYEVQKKKVKGPESKTPGETSWPGVAWTVTLEGAVRNIIRKLSSQESGEMDVAKYYKTLKDTVDEVLHQV